MRLFLFTMILLVLPGLALTAEDTLSLDRCVILNRAGHQEAESKIAIHFALPEELNDKEIMYAELYFDLPPFRLQSDSLFEIRVYPILAEWSEGNIGYSTSESITDSISVGANYLQLRDSTHFQIDLTSYVRGVIEGERQNFGLIGLTDLFGNANLRLPDGLSGQLRQLARIRVVYQRVESLGQ